MGGSRQNFKYSIGSDKLKGLSDKAPHPHRGPAGEQKVPWQKERGGWEVQSICATRKGDHDWGDEVGPERLSGVRVTLWLDF